MSAVFYDAAEHFTLPPGTVLTDQRKEALSRAALLAAMSLHISHAEQDTLPVNTRSTLAKSYEHMTEMTEDDVHALQPIYLKTSQCTEKGCIAMKSLYDKCSRRGIADSLKELDSSIPGTDLFDRSLRFMGEYGLRFAAESDLRQTWRLKQASKTVSSPGCLDNTTTDDRLNGFWLDPYEELHGPNHAPDTTLGSVEVHTLLEYDVVDETSTGIVGFSESKG